MTVARWTEPPEVVEISSLILDKDLQPRDGVDQEVIAEYAEAMQEEDANFPPIHVIQDIRPAVHFWWMDGNGSRRRRATGSPLYTPASDRGHGRMQSRPLPPAT
jgi:hypothetical protein